MGKRLVAVLLVLIVFLTAGFLLYRRAARNVPIGWTPSKGSSKSGPVGPAPANSNSAVNPPVVAGKSEPAGEKGIAPEFVFSPRAGESLEYAANVTKLNSTVANLKVTVAERKSFSGKSSWHLQAFAHTENPYRMVFQLDDQFDSYSDAGNMTSLQYEMHLSERGEKVDSVQRMLPSGRDAAPGDATAARVTAGTRDPLGMMQYLRGVDWSKTSEVRSPVYDGHKLYDVRAMVAGKNVAVSVPAGNYTTTKLEIRVLDNGAEMKDAHFLLYLSNDASRTPVLMEAVLPVASARVELTSAK
jgi:Protein of unknown function (DUF3108)